MIKERKKVGAKHIISKIEPENCVNVPIKSGGM